MTKDELIKHLTEYIKDAHISQEDIMPLFETITPSPEEERVATILHTLNCRRHHIGNGACTFYEEQYWSGMHKKYWYDEMQKFKAKYGDIDILTKGIQVAYNILSCFNIEVKCQLFILDILIPYLVYYKKLKQDMLKKQKEESVPFDQAEAEILSSRLYAPITTKAPTALETDLER